MKYFIFLNVPLNKEFRLLHSLLTFYTMSQLIWKGNGRKCI